MSSKTIKEINESVEKLVSLATKKLVKPKGWIRSTFGNDGIQEASLIYIKHKWTLCDEAINEFCEWVHLQIKEYNFKYPMVNESYSRNTSDVLRESILYRKFLQIYGEFSELEVELIESAFDNDGASYICGKTGLDYNVVKQERERLFKKIVAVKLEE